MSAFFSDPVGPGWIRFELEGGDLPFARVGRGRKISDEYIRIRVRQLISDAVEDIAGAVERQAKIIAPKQVGNLVEAIEKGRGGTVSEGSHSLLVTTGIFRESGAFPMAVVVGVDEEKAPYAKFVHGGTGLFPPGGSGNLIRPRKGKFMVFEKEGKTLWLKEVRGQKAQPFMKEAWEAVSVSYAPARFLLLKEQLGNLARH